MIESVQRIHARIGEIQDTFNKLGFAPINTQLPTKPFAEHLNEAMAKNNTENKINNIDGSIVNDTNKKLDNGKVISGDTSSDALTLAIEEGHPYLIYEGVALSDSAKSSLLYLKDINGEEHASAPASVSEENSIRIAFDLTLLEKRGVWYDLFLIDGGGASSFEFTTDDTPSYSEVIEHNHVQYRFENWEGVIKINAISL